ncbi:MAG: site-2 protease family protein [Candidatus Zambryskibacteria bacterium CG10_big_fil_rev_8_21_14_0_10_34_34]|uniref:Site-2 protease family protein n=1 Tax=Candidatus Zambryskibacteria bacterium CG10_big_fil_rev_8_21_14_0_10_34_34 TaxID=1975114 RepID=A0A2H0R1B0_9BACT|nr:MAG: site-2 protease family protein [Candidatus Zambryskibacteria bacterium CG10_big_fil_rev_8_21_14_0_10_34_34]
MDFIFIIIILIMSVVIHEVSHGYAALALGDPTAKYQGRLTLNPISHLDPIGSFFVPLIGYFAGGFIVGWAKPVPFNPYNLRNQKWGEALVAVAGPVSNIALAILFGLTIRFLPEYINVSQSFLNLASSVVLINIILAIFNLIPIPPLDGSKILFAFLPYKWQALRQSFERFGLILVFIFILFIWQIMSHIIGFLFTLLTGIAF